MWISEVSDEVGRGLAVGMKAPASTEGAIRYSLSGRSCVRLSSQLDFLLCEIWFVLGFHFGIAKREVRCGTSTRTANRAVLRDADRAVSRRKIGARFFRVADLLKI